MTKREPPTDSGRRFGAYVKLLREARKMKVGELAEQMGADRSRVWLCEIGNIPKRRATLDRLADAFTPALSVDERRQLYHLAGYTVYVGDPQAEDFARVADELRAEWLSATYPPVVISDHNWRIWFASDAFARLFTQVSPAEIEGRHALEVFFDARFGLRTALGRLAESHEIDAFLRTTLDQFRANMAHAMTEPWCRAFIQRMNEHQEFATSWAVLPRRAGGGGLLALYYLNLSQGGRLIVHGASIRTDPRFYLVLYLPTNVSAASTIERVLETT